MERIKKLLSVLLVATMVFTMFGMGMSVSAENVTTETNATSDSPLEIEVTTNKSNYGLFDVADITVNITNISDNTVENISAEAVFDDLAPVKKKASETYKEVECLQSGESFSFLYKATISKNKLNFFEKIALWFVRLFNGGFTANENNFDDGRDNISKTGVINFGNLSATNTIKVWFDLEGFTEQELDYMSSVDNTLKDLKSTNDFKSLYEDERKKKIEAQLKELEKQGKINSILYDTKTKSFIFMYSSGISGGVSLESYSDGPANELDFASQNTSRSNSIANNTLLTQFKNNQLTNNKKNIFISYGWDDINDSGSYYSGYAEMAEYYKSSYGLSVILSVDTTVEEYKTAFLGKDLVCIMEHGKTVAVHDFFGYENENFWLNTTYINTFEIREIPTKQTDANYYEDLHEHRIYKRDGVYCITPEFFSHYYSDNKLDDTIVFMGSCSAFGSGSVVDYNFSHEFCEYSAVDVIIGFHNDTRIGYSSSIMHVLITSLVNGMTVSESIKYGQEQLGYNDCEWIRKNYTIEEMSSAIEKNGKTLKENVEYYEQNNLKGTPIIAGIGATKWKFNFNVAGAVKDQNTNNALSGVKVSAIIPGGGSTTPVATTTTDENGDFSLSLPNGIYAIIFTYDNYENYGWEVTVNNGDVTLSKPILLTPKSQSDMVEYNGHQYKLFDLSMSWEEAKAYCENLGGHLATITSSKEQEFIENNLLSNSVKMNYYFLGGYRENLSDKWNWVTNEDFVYSNWNLDVEATQQISGQNYIIVGNKNAIELEKVYGWISHYNIDNSYEEWATKYTGFICEWENNSTTETVETINPKTFITQLEIVDHGQYTGNEGDSCVFHLDKSGLPGIHNAYCAFGNVGVDGTEYENGLEVWIARWNYTPEISWAYATYKLNSKYTTLTGKTNLIQSNNTDNFNTTVYFYDGDTLLASYTLTNDDYIKDINVDVTGVDELKILVQDNVAVCRGTSFALYDMFLA